MAKVLIQTTEGDIIVRLYDQTPQHRDNFLKNVREGYYDGVLFHRAIEHFMVQTGLFLSICLRSTESRVMQRI